MSPTPGEGETGVPNVMGTLSRAKIGPGIATSTNFQLRLKVLNCLMIYFDRSLASNFKNRTTEAASYLDVTSCLWLVCTRLFHGS